MLVSTLIALKSVIPNKTRDTARLVVRRVVEQLQRRLANATRQAVTGALNRATRTTRPRHAEIDWHRTIRANLKHYQPEYRTLKGWNTSTVGITSYDDLPQAAKDYVRFIEDETETQATIISTGPRREETIQR